MKKMVENKEYQKPVFEVVILDEKDIVTISGDPYKNVNDAPVQWMESWN